MKRILALVTCSLLFFIAVSQPSKKASTFFQNGITLEKNNKLPEALAAFKMAITFNKNFDSAYAEMGIIYVKQGKFDSAVVNFRKALALNPKMVETQIAFGNLYRDVKPNYDSAIICYSNALLMDSTNKTTFYSIAWCYNAKREFEKAIPFAIKALDIDNNYRAAYGELGHAYHNLKKYTEAIEQFKKNMAISQNDLPCYYSGMIYIELNQKEEALKMYESLLKINPKMAESLKKKIGAMK